MVVDDIDYLRSKWEDVGGGFDGYDGSSIAHAVEIGFRYREHGEVIVFGNYWW